MGWWKVQNTEHVVGDDVFQLLRDATMAVAAAYEQEFGRLPSKDEWQLLIDDSLQPFEASEQAAPISLFLENARPASVEIELVPLGARDASAPGTEQ